MACSIVIDSKDNDFSSQKRKAATTPGTSSDEATMLTLRELIPPLRFRDHVIKSRDGSAPATDQSNIAEDGRDTTMPLGHEQDTKKTPDDNNKSNQASDQPQTKDWSSSHKHANANYLDEPVQIDWNAVINRVKSHPQDARESYYSVLPPPFATIIQSQPPQPLSPLPSASNNSKRQKMNVNEHTVPQKEEPTLIRDHHHHEHPASNYKPLHAMLKYDPPLPAVEAVLRAYPYAAMEDTFEGTPLKIAAESRVSSMLVLRLLLVGEMAMRKKNELMGGGTDGAENGISAKQQSTKMMDDRDGDVKQPAGKQEQRALSSTGSDTKATKMDETSRRKEQHPLFSIFYGHNPIRWINEPRIPVKTAALLLKWYPMGAFQRRWDNEESSPSQSPFSSDNEFDDEHSVMESPLIEMVDDFARDNYHRSDDDPMRQMMMMNDNNNEDDYDTESLVDDDDNDNGIDNINEALPDQERKERSAKKRQQRNSKEKERLRRERRWEKFLHILYATDKALSSIRPKAGPPARAAAAAASKPDDTTPSQQHQRQHPFRPVHAWIRCITSPHLGLQHCRPYGCWSILRVMGQRIPSEFKSRDESDGGRTVFQTLAESPARDCCLCLEEVRDVVECLVDADYRSAFLPRRSDGRLIGHVALENEWPCRDLFARKASATCA